MTQVPQKILLIEDSEEEAELAVRALGRALRKRPRGPRGAAIQHVSDASRAIEVLREQEVPCRVVLADLKLPGMDGLQFVQWLRTDTRHRNTPVVVFSSSREDRDLERAYDLGVNSFVVKPMEPSEYARILEQLALYWAHVNVTPVTRGLQAAGE